MAKRKRLSFDSPITRLNPNLPDDTVPIAGVVADASATSALREVTETLEAAREGGRMVLDLPLEQIHLDHLVRDRLLVDEEDMAALIDSLRARGQQVPIEVTRIGPDRYGLISGWRRCQALIRLYEETEDRRFRNVQALIRQPAEASDAYCAMVEENEIRVGLSYYERARIVSRAVEQGVFPSSKKALQTLFASASRAKRSKIGTFLPIVTALDGHLRFPAAITERLGLQLGRALEDDGSLAQSLKQALTKNPPQDANSEAALLLAALLPEAPAPAPQVEPPAEPAPSPKTSDDTAEPLAPGIDMRFSEGRLTLRGRGVDADLAARIRALISD